MSDQAYRMDGPEARRNFWLTVGNGSIVLMGMSFFAPGTVLAGLVQHLTGSEFCVGLFVSLGAVGWVWPQLFIGNLVESRRRKMPFYAVSALVRVALLLAMAGVVYCWSGSDMMLYWVLLALFLAFSSAGGTVVIPFMDIVAKTVDRSRMSLLWGYRRMIGGLLGFLASLAVLGIMSDRLAIPFPANYAILLAIGALICGLAFFFFIRVREPVEEVPGKRTPFMMFLRRGPVVFRRDRDFRRFFVLRGMWAFARMSQAALFVPMADEYFDAAPWVTAAYFTAVTLLVGGLSSFAWGHVAQRFGEIRVMTVGAVLHLFSIATALGLAAMAQWGPTAGIAAHYYLVAYGIMYAFGTAAINGCDIAGMTYLLALPSAKLRPTYLAFMNTLQMPLLFAPALAGWLAQITSFGQVFALSALASLAAVFLARTLRRRSEANEPEFEFDEPEAA